MAGSNGATSQLPADSGVRYQSTMFPGALRSAVGYALAELALADGIADLGRIKSAVDQGFLDELSAMVYEHRLDAPFVAAMRQLNLTAPQGHTDRIVEDRVARMRATAALAALGPVLDDNKIEWAVVKGPMVARYLHHPEHRAYNDLDVLVAPPQFGQAITSLIAAGVQELNHNWHGYLKYQVGEVPMYYGGVPIDLHWSLVGLGRLRRTMKLDSNAMLRRRVPVSLDNSIDAFGLDDIDALLHLCVHAALSGAGRLDQLRDIASAVHGATSFDWNEFCERSRAGLVGPLVAHALDRSAIILGAPVPEAVRTELGGRSLSARRWVDSRTSSDQVSLRGLPVIAARDTAASRLRATAVLASARLTEKISPTHSWDFADPDSVLYQDTVAGGKNTRQAFIDSAR